MLVLTRRSGESILIGGDVRIRILRAGGSRVRIGIEAPSDVRIVREKGEDAPPLAGSPIDALQVPRPHLLRDGVTRNVAATARTGRESVPAPRQPASADRHTALE